MDKMMVRVPVAIKAKVTENLKLKIEKTFIYYTVATGYCLFVVCARASHNRHE